MDKTDIRKMITKERDMLSEDEISEKSRSIFEQLVEIPEYEKAKNILIYASMRSEVRTDEIILDAIASGKNVFCPKVTDKANGIMEFIRVLDVEDLKEGFYGIREPEITDESERFHENPEYLDSETVAVVPGVAFDAWGNRIGYNGGYYDRFLAGHKDIYTIALAYKLQIFDSIPVLPHDICMSRVISEEL